MTREEYKSHFLDDENWMTDNKVRLWDTRRATRRPNDYSWTSRLISANIFTFVLQAVKPQVTQWGVKLSDRILQGKDLYRLLSPVFLHGGIFHLFTNMYSLNNIGPMAEQVFGPGRFLATFLVSGAAGNLLSSYQSPNPALGASGAVFGIMAGLYVFLNRNDWILGAQGEAYSSAITQTLLINLFIGAVSPMM
jgi:membrane associated rhomboid family serine protease